MKYLILAIIFCWIIIAPPPVQATSPATLSITGPAKTTLGSYVTLKAKITSTLAINAIKATIQYQPDIVEITQVKIGNSILKYWQQEPTSNRLTNQIAFTGGLPNPGFQGSGGELVTIVLKAKAVGTTDVAFQDSQVLANDGNGTNVDANFIPYHLQILKPEPGAPVQTPPTHKDAVPPTGLELIIGHDGELFNGQWFAVFQATDNESGIDHYELAETDPHNDFPSDTEWRKATSPTVLEKQNQKTKVFLKAVDKAGNENVISSTHNPKQTNLISPKTNNRSWLISLITLILFALIIRTLTRLRKSRNRKTR